MKRGINNSSSATSRWGSMFGTKTTVTPRKKGDDQDDLLLFGKIHKQSEKERGNNLLQPISSDHDLLDYSVSDPNSGSFKTKNTLVSSLFFSLDAVWYYLPPKTFSLDAHAEINNEQEQEHASTTIVSSRGRIHRASGGSNNRSSHYVFGSKMVDKVMNARRSTTLSSVAQNARGFASSSLMINNEVSGFRKSSPSSSPSSAAQNQDIGTMYEPKFESSTSSSSLPISNEKPSAGILKTSSDMALRDSKDTRKINHQAANLTRNIKNSKHDHSSKINHRTK
ncbi:hypothetical protein MKX03_011034 [Papaver bracteatum]|nr:hypothetical protein MKX03_011034 [Papaver bracteatum]